MASRMERNRRIASEERNAVSDSRWTPTGRMRWVQTKNGERVLQQFCEHTGWRSQWMTVPTVSACRVCDGVGDINGGFGTRVLCAMCMGEGVK